MSVKLPEGNNCHNMDQCVHLVEHMYCAQSGFETSSNPVATHVLTILSGYMGFLNKNQYLNIYQKYMQ